jgi:hypothetical protein
MVTSVAVWGFSMGAATALMHSRDDPTIDAMVRSLTLLPAGLAGLPLTLVAAVDVGQVLHGSFADFEQVAEVSVAHLLKTKYIPTWLISPATLTDWAFWIVGPQIEERAGQFPPWSHRHLGSLHTSCMQHHLGGADTIGYLDASGNLS